MAPKRYGTQTFRHPNVTAPKRRLPNDGTQTPAPKRRHPNAGTQTLAPKRRHPTAGTQMSCSVIFRHPRICSADNRSSTYFDGFIRCIDYRSRAYIFLSHLNENVKLKNKIGMHHNILLVLEIDWHQNY